MLKLEIIVANDITDPIKVSMAGAIVAGGFFISELANASGDLGYFYEDLAIYDRVDKPCKTCDAQVKRLVQAGRSTFYCSNCQR